MKRIYGVLASPLSTDFMKVGKILAILMMLISCHFMIPGVSMSQDNSGSSSNPLGDLLMNILQEGFDEWIGNYKGSLGDVKLLERLGNKVVLEVTYNNVKRSDNVYVQGEVLDMGTPLEGFKNSLNSVSGSQGKVRLAIKWVPEGDAEWGTVQSESVSDQIRLYLVRESNPDRPFGEIIYDISKTWTDSDAPDEEAGMMADADSIELEDGETESESGSSGTTKPSGVFIKPGTILTPRTDSMASAGTAGKDLPPAAAQTTPSKQTSTAKPILGKPIQARAVLPTTFYDFYSKANTAVWRSSGGRLTYPGSPSNPKGYARPFAKGKVNPGTETIDMIETRPERKAAGWIEAQYPEMVLGDNLKFKTIAGFRYGINKSNGAAFQVYVKERGRYNRVVSLRVAAGNFKTISADLSRWARKKVQIVLRVRTIANTNPNGAVWVKPRLSK